MTGISGNTDRSDSGSGVLDPADQPASTAEPDSGSGVLDPADQPASTAEPSAAVPNAGSGDGDRRKVPLTQPCSVNPWLARAGLVALAVALLMVPEVLGDPTRIRQWAEYLCYAMVALGLSIAWGRGGMLALGQGVFFGLGAYSMGMYLELDQLGAGQTMPEFMRLYGHYTELPLLWRPFGSFGFAAVAALAVPMLVAGLLGWLVFRNRIRGPYFAILTQATALVFWLLLTGNLELTNGTNGFSFSQAFGRNRFTPGTSEFFYMYAAVALIVLVLLGRQLVRSRYGRLLVAIRDNENRVRFLGYDPAAAKTVAFVVAAGMAGVAGAFSAPIIGTVAPNQFAAIPSIFMLVWVAVGGRGSIYGAVIGALLVSWTKTTVSESRPEDWLYVQGLLFIVVIAWVPGGLAGLVNRAREWIGARMATRRPGAGGRSSPGAEPVHAAAALEVVK